MDGISSCAVREIYWGGGVTLALVSHLDTVFPAEEELSPMISNWRME
jgi:hypothetical protein